MPINIPFLLVAVLTLAAAIAAMRLRNLVHCALCAALAFTGLALAYLLLEAEFVALAQFLVYVGAVAVLLVFGIMLTRGAAIGGSATIASPRPWWGLLAALMLCGTLVAAVVTGFSGKASAPSVAAFAPPVRQIGEKLMSDYVVCLEGVGLLLTAALLGAVVIAIRESAPAPERPVALPTPPARKNLETIAQP